MSAENLARCGQECFEDSSGPIQIAEGTRSCHRGFLERAGTLKHLRTQRGCDGLHRYEAVRRASRTKLAVRRAIAMIVIIGFTPGADGNTDASPTNRFRTSRISPDGFAADPRGSVPIEHPPIRWALKRATACRRMPR